MQQPFSLFRRQQKPLEAHKGEEQKRGRGLNKSHLPGARAPRTAEPISQQQKHSGHILDMKCPSGCPGAAPWMMREGSQRGGGTGGRRWRWVARGCKTHGKKSEQVNDNKAAAARSIPADSHPATGWGWCLKERNKECRLHLSEKNKIRGLFSPRFLFWEPPLPPSPQQQRQVWLTQAMLISAGAAQATDTRSRVLLCHIWLE